MASRQQQKGTAFGIQYEDLVPKSELKDQPEATLLTIDLPGFTKEQIKVTYVHTSKMIRVIGERPVTDQRWSRFNEVFTVPQNCIVDKINGSFKDNILTITMPKETITKLYDLPETSKTVAEKVKKLEEKRLLEETIKKEKVEEAEMKKEKKLLEEKDELIKKLLEEKDELIKKLQEEAKAKEMAEARKLQEEAIVKEKDEARKLQEEAIAKEKLEERKLVEEATLEKKILKKEERKLPEVVYAKSGTGTKTKSVSEGVREVAKSGEEKLGYLFEKEKKIGKGMIEKIRRKEITSEEKKLMVNVGVASLVIFALGAFVSYTLCSSSSSSSSSSSPSSSSSSTKPE